MANLDKLSAAATGGEWTVLGSGRDCWVDEWNYGYDGEVPQADIEYTCRLSNDYRAGELVEAEAMRDELIEARQALKALLDVSERNTDDAQEWDAAIGAARAALNLCRKCGEPMRPGKATAQTCVGGSLDFPSDPAPVTMSAGGPGELIDCMKCPECGWSVTAAEAAMKGEKG